MQKNKEYWERTAAKLADRLEATGTAWRPGLSGFLWLAGCMLFFNLVMYTVEQFPGEWYRLLTAQPARLAALINGLLVSGISVVLVIRDSVPDSGRFNGRLWMLPLFLFAFSLVWQYPGLPEAASGQQSDLIKRPHCAMEILIYPLLPFAGLMLWLRNRCLMHPVRSSLLAGIGLSQLVAASMSYSCSAEPLHVLTTHMVPVIVSGFLASAFSLRAWQKSLPVFPESDQGKSAKK